MKKITFSVLSLFLLIVGVSNDASAQSNRRSSFRVDAPANISGYKITSEIDNTGASPWGTNINSKWENIPVAYDQANPNGCAAFTPGYFTGKFALIYRGSCEFGSKALAAQNAGATGVIIVNNLLGVAGMGAGADGINVTIPVVMVTTEAGNDIKTQLLNNIPVNVSLTAWRFDSIANPIDIGYMNDGPLFSVGKAIPSHQVLGSADDSFRVYSGGRFYNFSSMDFDTINLQGRFSYNPNFTGGTFTQIDSNFISYYFNTPITTLDSVLFLKLDTINNNLVGFDLNDAPLGRYSMRNTVLSIPFTETNSAQLNNDWTYEMAITDSIYSKCEYNFNSNTPTANSYINVNATNNYYWGPVLYIRNGSYKANSAQVMIMRDVIEDSTFNGQEVSVSLFKWTDVNGDNNIDGVNANPSELEEVGNGSYTLSANDFVPITGLPLNITLNNLLTPGSPLTLDADSRYWLVVALGNNNTYGIGTDYYADYSGNLAGNVSRGNPLYDITASTMYGGGFANGGSPSIALHMSVDPVGIRDIVKFDGTAKVYPNPTSGNVNVSIALNNTSKEVSYEIVDITGKTITTTTKANVKNDIFTYNTNKLSNGTYFVNINTESGKTQLKFVVAK